MNSPHECPHCGGFIMETHATIELGGVPEILAGLRKEIGGVLRRQCESRPDFHSSGGALGG